MKTRKTLVLLMMIAVAGLLVTYTAARPPRGEHEEKAEQLEQRERRLQDELKEIRRQLEKHDPDEPRRGRYPSRRLRLPDEMMMEPRPPRRDPQMDRMHAMMEMLERLGDVSFSPAEAGLIAIGVLVNEIPRQPKDVIKDLEQALGRTKALGLRNAIRLSLKDLYKDTNQNEKVLLLMREMLAENDAALTDRQQKRDDDEDDKKEDKDDD